MPMRVSRCTTAWSGVLLAAGMLSSLLPAALLAAPPRTTAAAASAACRQATLSGEVKYGHAFSADLGNGLIFYLQPIASGWILRVMPSHGPRLDHDYAELATPPYQSVTPLSLSTDFAFRAQDAVGWNPRRFRFATSAALFERLKTSYEAYGRAGNNPPPAAQAELAGEVGRASEATFTILDAQLIPGTANQWRMAAAVASHFSNTAHTLVDPPAGESFPLGRLLSVRFRVDLQLPPEFRTAPGLRTVPHLCGTP